MALDEADLLRLLHSTEHTFVERKTMNEYSVEGEVTACNQFYVRVLYNNQPQSYPLKRVEIAFDHRDNRLELQVSPSL